MLIGGTVLQFAGCSSMAFSDLDLTFPGKI